MHKCYVMQILKANKKKKKKNKRRKVTNSIKMKYKGHVRKIQLD